MDTGCIEGLAESSQPGAEMDRKATGCLEGG